MTKQKSTKRALLLSALSLLMCVSMLVGSTFAWFTDSVISGSNVIQAGTLDIVMEYWDGDSWEDAEGKVLEFRKASTSAGTEVLWEPGCTYELPKIRVRNEGNLSAKLILKLNGVTGDEKLLEAIDLTTTISNMPESILSGSQANILAPFNNATVSLMYGTPDGTIIFDWSLMGKGVVSPNSGHTDTSPEFTISGHMKEEAGNEYQGLKIEGVSITALAAQLNYEYDSFNRDYDKNAEFFTTVKSFADMVNVCKTGGKMILGNDLTYTAESTEMMIAGSVFLINGKDVTLDLNGHSIIIEEDATKVYGSLFFVGNPGGHINIVGDGEIIIKNGLATVVWVLQTGTANIYGGTYTSNSVSNEAMIYSQGNGGVINVYGGKYTYDLDRHLNGGFNVSDNAGKVLRIILHEGVLLSRPEYSQHLQGTTNGEENRIKLAEGCSLEEVVIDGVTWYQVVKA